MGCPTMPPLAHHFVFMLSKARAPLQCGTTLKPLWIQMAAIGAHARQRLLMFKKAQKPPTGEPQRPGRSRQCIEQCVFRIHHTWGVRTKPRCKILWSPSVYRVISVYKFWVFFIHRPCGLNPNSVAWRIKISVFLYTIGVFVGSIFLGRPECQDRRF